MSDFGYGQQGPNSATSDYNTQAFIIQQALARVRTVVLVKIKAVTNEGGVSAVGFVDAQPLVNMVDGQGNATEHGTIYQLPYFRLQGGTNAVILDPQVGDIGIALIADRDISAVKSEKKLSTPGSSRKFNLADGLYIGGVLNGVPEQYVRFSEEGIELKSATKVTIDAPTVKVVGNFQATGTVVAGFGTVASVNLQTHKHGIGTPLAPGTIVPTAGT